MALHLIPVLVRYGNDEMGHVALSFSFVCFKKEQQTIVHVKQEAGLWAAPIST